MPTFTHGNVEIAYLDEGVGEPIVLNHGRNALFQIAAEAATRAVRRCQPFRLPASKYEAWQEVEVNFDPNDMFRG